MVGHSLLEKMVGYRRDFHRHAESGWLELRTTAVIAGELEALGYRVLLGDDVVCRGSIMGRPGEDVVERHIERAASQGALGQYLERMGGLTGVCAILDTGRQGPITALRFDIDALDIVESVASTHRPVAEGFASINEGMMHACGHDGHAAIGLGIAHLLVEHKEQLRGVIKLVFQPAEEGLRGGKPMADSGILDDVDNILAAHIGLNVPTGTVCTSTGGFLSSTKFDVEIRGVGAHAGGAPNEGKNALLAAASATVMMHAIAPHKDGPTRINVGVLNAGSGRNVIAERATMKLETRGGNLAINDYVYESVVNVFEGACKVYGTSYTMEKVGYAADFVCDASLASLADECANDLQLQVRTQGDISGSEDFSWMAKRVQQRGGRANYLVIGAATAAGHHNSSFDFDEDALGIGAALLSGIVRRLNA